MSRTSFKELSKNTLYLAYAFTQLKNPNTKQLMEFTGFESNRTLMRYISTLSETHGIYITWVGAKKNGHWEIKWEGTKKEFVIEKFSLR